MISREHGWLGWRYWLARLIWRNPMRDPENVEYLDRHRQDRRR